VRVVLSANNGERVCELKVTSLQTNLVFGALCEVTTQAREWIAANLKEEGNNPCVRPFSFKANQIQKEKLKIKSEKFFFFFFLRGG